MTEWANTQVLRPDHGLPVVADMDVVVVGGGAAGVAAAETIGRHGANVLLIERYGFCGGNAVAGMSGTVCGMFLASDSLKNEPTQVVFGFTERFRAAMDFAGGITIHTSTGVAALAVSLVLQARSNSNSNSVRPDGNTRRLGRVDSAA